MHSAPAVLLALALTAGLAGCGKDEANPPAGTAQSPPPAAPAAQRVEFQFVDTEGQVVTDASLLGKPIALYFGSTGDTGAARTVLANFASAVGALGPASDRLTVAFVSLDAERDTPERVKAYLSEVGPGIRGLTGSAESVAAMAKAYKVPYSRIAHDDGSYTVEHPTAVYLYDRYGFYLQKLDQDRSRDELLSELRKLAGSRYAMGGHLGPGAKR